MSNTSENITSFFFIFKKKKKIVEACLGLQYLKGIAFTGLAKKQTRN